MDSLPRDLSWNEIQETQRLIERCLLRYMRQSEIMIALRKEANIDPVVTCTVWERLEEQNKAFFEGYTVMTRVKDQINAFNVLVEKHNRIVDQAEKSDSLE